MIKLKKAIRKFEKKYKVHKQAEKTRHQTIISPLERVIIKEKGKEKLIKDDIKKPKFKKIDIEDVKRIHVPSIEEEFDMEGINVKYPLTPPYPKKGEDIRAWCNIIWDQKINSLMYKVNEPPITSEDQKTINLLKQIIEEKIDIDFKTVKREAAIKYLRESITKIIEQFGMEVPLEKRNVYEYYILRDFVELSKIQPIMNDENIEDISCDGVNIPIFIYHRDPKFGSLMTNVIFKTNEEIDDFVIKLSQRCEKSISVAEPLLQGALPDGSRVQATLGVDIARRGSNFTIRKFTKEPLTPLHLLNFGTVDTKTLAYLWLAIEYNNSILIAGPTASGKTSLLNALSLFIKPTLKIVSIEDTPELRLPHIHWIPEVAREGFGEKAHGEVSLFDLLKGSLRQRPEYIIVGEVRGKEAYVLFQQMATGHSGLSTLHADSIEKVIDRLTTPPIELPASLLETLDIILFIRRIKYKNEYVRKISQVLEIEGYDLHRGELIRNNLLNWDALTNKFNILEGSYILGKISETMGINEDVLKKEIYNRMKVLSWMREKYITHYQQVARVINAYYSRPDDLMTLIEAE